MRVAVGIPAYNCQLQIERVLKELDSVISSKIGIQSVFVIDNRSSDLTIQAALKAVLQMKNSGLVEVYRNFENAGLGGSHKVAFTLARNKDMTHLLILHGDHQAAPRDIPSLLQASDGSSVLGSRFSEISKLKGYSFVRTAGNLALNALYSVFTFKKITDLGSGLNLFRISDFAESDLQNFDNGFAFNMDLLLYLIRTRTAFTYVPISWSTTDQISNAKALQVGLKTLKKLFLWLLRIPQTNKNYMNSEKLN